VLDVDLPPGLAARPPTPADLAAALAVIGADEVAATGQTFLTEEDLRSEWAQPSIDLALDVVLVLDGGAVVGYADQHAGRSFVAVHPDHHGRGIGAALLDWTERSARHHGLPTVGQTVGDAHGAARALLRSRGYAERWSSWVFAIPLEGAEVAAVPAPEGVELRSLRRPDEDEAAFEVVETAFSEWPDRELRRSFEDWRAAHLDRDDTDPDLVVVAVEAAEVIGVSQCLVEGDEGWVEQLAVARGHRGRGLGKALLGESFRRFAARGCTTVGLSTDSRTGARSLYEQVGMQVTSSFTRWSRELSA
jgi:mycothiol synthase